MSKRYRKELGTINLTKGMLDITDPCYDKDVWCRTTLYNVKPGNWKGRISVADEGDWGMRVAYLELVNENAAMYPKYKHHEASIGVDAGLCGFFENKPDYDKDWSNICDYIFSHDEGIIFDEKSPFKCKGIVSSSGYGDGSYELYTAKNKSGEYTAIKVVFIDYNSNATDEDVL